MYKLHILRQKGLIKFPNKDIIKVLLKENDGKFRDLSIKELKFIVSYLENWLSDSKINKELLETLFYRTELISRTLNESSNSDGDSREQLNTKDSSYELLISAIYIIYSLVKLSETPVQYKDAIRIRNLFKIIEDQILSRKCSNESYIHLMESMIYLRESLSSAGYNGFSLRPESSSESESYSSDSDDERSVYDYETLWWTLYCKAQDISLNILSNNMEDIELAIKINNVWACSDMNNDKELLDMLLSIILKKLDALTVQETEKFMGDLKFNIDMDYAEIFTSLQDFTKIKYFLDLFIKKHYMIQDFEVGRLFKTLDTHQLPNFIKSLAYMHKSTRIPTDDITQFILNYDITQFTTGELLDMVISLTQLGYKEMPCHWIDEANRRLNQPHINSFSASNQNNENNYFVSREDERRRMSSNNEHIF